MNEYYEMLSDAYVTTCRHIEELERIEACSNTIVGTSEAKERARLLINKMIELEPKGAEPC